MDQSVLPPTAPGRTIAFVSYAHEDGEYLDRLGMALKPYERSNEIAIWDDRSIAPSQDWQREIEQALERARIAVLLVSPAFFASDFIQEIELPTILSAQEADGMVILPMRALHNWRNGIG